MRLEASDRTFVPRYTAGLLSLLVFVPLAAGRAGSRPQGDEAAAILRPAWDALHRYEPDFGFDAEFTFRSTATYRGMSVNGRREESAAGSGRVFYRGPGRLSIRSKSPVPAEAEALLREATRRSESLRFEAEFESASLAIEREGEREVIRVKDGARLFLAGPGSGAREWVQVRGGRIAAAAVRLGRPGTAESSVVHEFESVDVTGGVFLRRVTSRWHAERFVFRDVAVTPVEIDGTVLPGTIDLVETVSNRDPDIPSALSKGGVVGMTTTARMELTAFSVRRGLAPPSADSPAGAVLEAAWARFPRVPSEGGTLRARVRAEVSPGRPGGPVRVAVEGDLVAAFPPDTAPNEPAVTLESATVDRRCPPDAAPFAVSRAISLCRTALLHLATPPYRREFAGVEARLSSEHPLVRIETSPWSAAAIEMPSADGGFIRLVSAAGATLKEIRLEARGDVRLPVRIAGPDGVETLSWTRAGGVFVPARYRTIPTNDRTREEIRFDSPAFE